MSNPENSTSPIRVGIIGSGLRGASYFRNIPAELADRVQLVAIADPDQDRRTAFAELFAAQVPEGTTPTGYDDGLELLHHEDLDAVVVASPNFQHVPYAVEAMSQSLPLMLEKPVATTVEDLATLWRAHTERTAGETVVGFVLRYTPFYSAVREIVQSGRLGEILAVEANENLGTGLTMVQYRGWRQDTAKSGGWMVEKCCHDMDILSHLLGSRPSRVFSMASALHLRPRPEAEQLPRFQPSAGTGEIDFGDAATNEALRDTMQHSPYAPSNLPDRQVATIEFENGTLATFTAVMAQPKTTRRLRIFGTEGLLEGDISAETIELSFPDPNESTGMTTEQVEVAVGGSGHHGGDEVLGDTFWHLAAGEQRTIRAGLVDGIDAVLTALSLQRSAESGAPVDLAELRTQVFGTADDLREAQRQDG
ncbi:MAG TPA: Gfo/Idh/MocA family oxidoreductase [Candidatus Avipropionibacterium avicola]|uniref:Gfo/Idh/MocA family oxidoreductase n=1 Tax=Candidatus Avipropionibacterium avicola TaxID=2840701 RepID=A0A9D1GV12_9ACTN|nr:Gfo/Idh/MocA family oxidoreductase [Candidatus Avipropionibacterium avicola]